MTEMERFIREYAASIGIDPEQAMRVALSEGGRQSLDPAGYARQSLVGGTGAGQEQSFGPFQMYMGAGALGDRALKAGFDPRDPVQAFNVVKFALDTAKKEGWGAWHGWKGDPWAGISGKGTGANVAVPTGLRHVGGAGSGKGYFTPTATETAPGTTETPYAPAQYTLTPERKQTTAEHAGDALKNLLNGVDVGMGSAPAMAPVGYMGGDAVPSVMRTPFQPMQAPMPGGGGDLRALLAQLMGGQRA